MKSREIRKFRKTYTKYTHDCISEGYKLAVLFDEKDGVKKYGGRWHPYPNEEGGYWYMPAKHLTNEALPDQTTVCEWLNDNQMIVGQYGDLDENRLKDAILGGNLEPISYRLVNPQDDSKPLGTFYVYKDLQVAKWVTVRMEKWVHLEEARTTWNELMEAGFRQVLQETS